MSIPIKIQNGIVEVKQNKKWIVLGEINELQKTGVVKACKDLGLLNQEKIYEIKENIKHEVLFGKEKKKKDRLGQGIIDGKFYHATEVEPNGKIESCLITSDGKGEKEVYVGDGIKEELGLKYTSEFDEDALSYPWSNSAIKKYVTNNYKKINLLELLNKQKTLWEKYIYLNDKREHYLHPCFALNTYCFSLFTHQARIDFRGQTESGKSTASKIYKLTAFNSIWVNKGSDAARFRDLEATCGTLIIDNFDSLPAEVKEDVCYFIEVSFDAEGGTKRIMESVGKNSFRGKTLRVYCSMIVNSKLGYGVDSTQNRLITTVMGKKKMPKLDTKLKEWESIRNESRVWVLDNWKEIKKTYEELETGFDSRADDIYKPILTIAKMAGEEYYNNILALLKDKFELLKETQGEDDFERVVLTLLLEEIGEQKSAKISVPGLAEKLIVEHFGFDKEQDREKFMGKKKYCGKIVKTILRNIPALSKADRITHPKNRETYLVYQKEIVEYMQIRGYLKEGGNSYANLNLY